MFDCSELCRKLNHCKLVIFQIFFHFFWPLQIKFIFFRLFNSHGPKILVNYQKKFNHFALNNQKKFFFSFKSFAYC